MRPKLKIALEFRKSQAATNDNHQNATFSQKTFGGGEVLKVGEFLGGFELIEVTGNNVIFRRDGKQFTLTYRKGEDELK